MINAKGMIAAFLIAASPAAHAQWVVVDPTLNQTALATFAKEAMVEIHAAQQVLNTAQTVMNTVGILNSVAHGNIMGITRLAPLLQGSKLTQPLGLNTNGIAEMMSGIEDIGNVGGEVMNLYGQARNLTTLYTPGGNDYQAQAMMQRARSAAGQLAVAGRYLDSGSDRLASLPALTLGAENTADLKSAIDAANTLAGQQVTQGAQTNQLLSLQIYQHAEEAAQRGRDEQEWRRGADTLATQARAAAAAAGAGKVQLISGQ